MLWHTPRSLLGLADIGSESRLIVLAEESDIVLKTLLIRPAVDLTNWTDHADWLDLNQLAELTVIGEIKEAFTPSMTPEGHWGLCFYQSLNPGCDEARAKQQLNYKNTTLLTQFISQNTGTLLWVSDASPYQKGDEANYRAAWAIAPVEGFLTTEPAVGYQEGAALSIEFLFRNTSHDALTQRLATGEVGSYGLAVEHCPITLLDAQSYVATTYPSVEPEV